MKFVSPDHISYIEGQVYSDPVFREIIADLVSNPDVLKLDEFMQHMSFTRLAHSMAVSYVSYSICKTMRLDYRSGARAGLLHDLFHYTWNGENSVPKARHAFDHPRIALENAMKITELNFIEKDAILKHMWPLCASAPKYMESHVVSWADKYCTTQEVAISVMHVIRKKLRKNKAFDS